MERMWQLVIHQPLGMVKMCVWHRWGLRFVAEFYGKERNDLGIVTPAAIGLQLPFPDQIDTPANSEERINI